jgi:cyclopropane-fatty-acyl-phospholipid synthase
VRELRRLSVLDVENLRRHYAATLAEWFARFENAADEVRSMFDERFVRMWRLWPSGFSGGFPPAACSSFR